MLIKSALALSAKKSVRTSLGGRSSMNASMLGDLNFGQLNQ